MNAPLRISRRMTALVWLSTLVLTVAGRAAPAPDLRIGLPKTAFIATNLNDATAAYRVFVERLVRDRGLEAEVKSEVFVDGPSLVQALDRPTDPLHFVVMLGWDLVNEVIPPRVRPGWVIAIDGEPGRNFVILARRDRAWRSLADLRDHSLIMWLSSGTEVSQFWLDTLLHEQGLPSARRHFSVVTEAEKPSNVILPVFFGAQDACLIDEASFKLMGELNPQVTRDLEVIARSDRFADILICLCDGAWPAPTWPTVLSDAINHLAETVEGRHILTMFRVEALRPFDPSQLDSLRTLRHRWLAIQSDTASSHPPAP